jgi:acetone carboxylase gamma subunit
MSYPKTVIRDLIDGRLPWSQTHQVMSAYKDTDRFEQYVEILQERASWDNRILLPLTDHLSIVEAGEQAVVKCECGHEFGDYRLNWKLSALIKVRRTEADVEEIYGPFGCDPEWMELREFICPGCLALLEVDAAVPGYPIVFDFRPDLVTLYRDWLHQEPPAWLEG